MGKAKKEQLLQNFLREKALRAEINGIPFQPIKSLKQRNYERFIKEREEKREIGLQKLAVSETKLLKTIDGHRNVLPNGKLSDHYTGTLLELYALVMTDINKLHTTVRSAAGKKLGLYAMYDLVLETNTDIGNIEIVFFRKNSGAISSGANLKGKSISSTGFDAQFFKCYFKLNGLYREVTGCLSVDEKFMFDWWNMEEVRTYGANSVGNVAVSPYNKVAGKGSKTAGERYGKIFTLPKTVKPVGSKNPPELPVSYEQTHRNADICTVASAWNI